MRKFIIYLIIIFIIIFLLNSEKFTGINEKFIPDWLSHSENGQQIERKTTFTGIKKLFKPENLLYYLTGVRPAVPVSYLKQEIPFLAFYTPPELKDPGETVFETTSTEVVKLRFDLNRQEQVKEDKPVVIIYHSHTSETYIDDPRPQDGNGHVKAGNVGKVGQIGYELARELSDKFNFRVIHTTRIHDNNYVRSYYNSRQTLKELLEQNERVDLVLDIHRDGIESRKKSVYTTSIQENKIARVMIVVTDGKFEFANLNLDQHGEWERNLYLGQKMAGKMEELYPGMLLRLEIRDTIYNQDLHPRALLLEIGDYQNTTAEAMRTARYLARVIAEITPG